jgi:hypothetical protein
MVTSLNWQHLINEIPDLTAREAVLNAKFVFPINVDNSSLDKMLTNFEKMLSIPEKEFPHETELEKIVRCKNWFTENGLPMQEALALLTLHEAKLGNFGAAIKAYDYISKLELQAEASVGRNLSLKMSKARAKRQYLEKMEIEKQRHNWQLVANQYWQKHPTASKREIATHIYNKTKKYSNAKSIETIRKTIMKS